MSQRFRSAYLLIRRIKLKLEKSPSQFQSDSAPALANTGSPDISALSRDNTFSGDAQDALVPQLISQQARKTPDALSLSSEAHSLTYYELEECTNRLANDLRALGLGTETLVGICLPRSPEMIVAALAIMKAGGAYVPLDPEYPVERLQMMLRGIPIRVLITQSHIRRALAAGDWQVMLLDATQGRLQRPSPTFEPTVVNAENLAYAIYTSGSSGRPKAVQIVHSGLLNLVRWHQRAFSVTSADRATQVASFGFDAAAWEVWPYLCSGASVHFPDDTTRGSVIALRDWIVKRKVTISFVPTALAESMITLDWPSKIALRVLLTGGDTLHKYPPSDLPFLLVNNYGPTECTVVTTSGVTLPGDHAESQPTIGRSIDNVQTYICNERLERVPIGTVGELYIGGAGLSRGYLNNPELTAAAFVPNPFSDSPGDRLYKTGDLVRCLPNGEIAFVGRQDEQIKIRGYRIEPNEIVTTLNQCPGVQSSVVVAQPDASGDKRLVAYLVASNDQLTRSLLQNYLRTYLPDYMIPTTFVRLDSLPMKPSGKIDRSALPSATSLNTVGDNLYTAPRTQVEQRMVSILSELLGLEKVGVHDNFFFLGGHSLLGTQLIARARDAFGVELPLRKVFDSPTAAELATEIERMLDTNQISAD